VCKSTFRKEYGHPFPEIGRSRLVAEDTPAGRSFVLFRYNSVARGFREWLGAVQAARPGQETSIVLSAVPQYALERYPSGICWDILGRDVPVDEVIVTAFPSSFDYRGPKTHHWITETAKHLVGAFKHSRACIVCNLYDCNIEGSTTSVKREIDGAYLPVRVRPVDVYGNAVSCVANGVKTFFYYSYKFAKDEKREAIQKGYGLLEAVEPWLQGSRLPRDVALLYSRAGGDFYSLAFGPHGLSAEEDGSEGMFGYRGWAQPVNRIGGNFNSGPGRVGSLGFRAQKEAVHGLISANQPFDLHFLDQLTQADVDGYTVLLLPFAYSIPDSAVELVRKRVAQGARALIVGPIGERDGKGEERGIPALLGLLNRDNMPGKRTVVRRGKGTVVYLPEAERQTLVAEVSRLLGENRSLSVTKVRGNDVEVILRENAGEKLLFLVNWEERESEVEINLRVAPGAYRVAGRDIAGESFRKVCGKETLTEQDLGKLRVALEPQDVKVLRFSRADKGAR